MNIQELRNIGYENLINCEIFNINNYSVNVGRYKYNVKIDISSQDMSTIKYAMIRYYIVEFASLNQLQNEIDVLVCKNYIIFTNKEKNPIKSLNYIKYQRLVNKELINYDVYGYTKDNGSFIYCPNLLKSNPMEVIYGTFKCFIDNNNPLKKWIAIATENGLDFTIQNDPKVIINVPYKTLNISFQKDLLFRDLYFNGFDDGKLSLNCERNPFMTQQSNDIEFIRSNITNKILLWKMGIYNKQDYEYRNAFIEGGIAYKNQNFTSKLNVYNHNKIDIKFISSEESSTIMIKKENILYASLSFRNNFISVLDRHKITIYKSKGIIIFTSLGIENKFGYIDLGKL